MLMNIFTAIAIFGLLLLINLTVGEFLEAEELDDKKTLCITLAFLVNVFAVLMYHMWK